MQNGFGLTSEPHRGPNLANCDSITEEFFRRSLLALEGAEAGWHSLEDLCTQSLKSAEALVALRGALLPLTWPYVVRERTPSQVMWEAIALALKIVPSPGHARLEADDHLASLLLKELGVSGIEAEKTQARPESFLGIVDIGHYLADVAALAHLKAPPRSIASMIRKNVEAIGQSAVLFLLQGDRLRATRLLKWLCHPILHSLPRSEWVGSFVNEAIFYLSAAHLRPFWAFEFELAQLRHPRLW